MHLDRSKFSGRNYNRIRQSIYPCSRQNFYSWVFDKDEYLYSNLNNLSKILSFTKQHEELRIKAINKARQRYNPEKIYNPYVIEYAESERRKSYIDSYVWNVMRKHSFKDISQYPIIDETLIKKFRLEKLKEDYIIIANELASYDNSTVEEYISKLDHKQQKNIRKMFRYIKKTRKLTNALHELYVNLLK